MIILRTIYFQSFRNLMAYFILICLFWCADNFSLNNQNRSGCVFVWLYGFCLRLLLYSLVFFFLFFLLWRVNEYTYYTRCLFYKHFFDKYKEISHHHYISIIIIRPCADVLFILCCSSSSILFERQWMSVCMCRICDCVQFCSCFFYLSRHFFRYDFVCSIQCETYEHGYTL